MRFAIFAAVVVLVGCGPGTDPLVGTFTFTMTGTDTNTAPNTNSSTPTGTGMLAITSNAAMSGYLITLAHNQLSPCVFEATAAEKATAPELTIKAEQKCTFDTGGGGSTVVTITSGKGVLKLNDTRALDVMTLDASYTYTGVTPILTNLTFAGNGKRTYTGTRR